MKSWHLHDVEHIHPLTMCGQLIPPLMTKKIGEVTCCTCLKRHEARLERSATYREAREVIDNKAKEATR